MSLRPMALLVSLGLLAACARNDLVEPPMPLGDFALGLNVVVADKVQKVPISRPATIEEWETEMQKAVDARFGPSRYKGGTLYNIGIAVDGYALAPPGIPVVAAPKSILVVTANIWEDAKAKKLNPEGKQLTIFEGLSGDTVIGSGLTRTKKQQMEALAFNAARQVELWLVEHPEWFGLTQAQMDAALAAREADIKAAAAKAPEEAAPADEAAEDRAVEDNAAEEKAAETDAAKLPETGTKTGAKTGAAPAEAPKTAAKAG